MKIVQSFWTRPYMQAHLIAQGTELEAGWPSRSLHFCSWALSCLQLRKFYDRVELVTDDLGKEILIDQLRLPYTHVSVALNDLEKYDAGMWALGKVYAYGLQQEPFVHVDGDIFIFNPIDESVMQAPLIAQNTDNGYPGYWGPCKTTWDSFTDIPAYFAEVYETQMADCCNAGIIGGHNISFMQRFVKEVFSFYEKNKEAAIHSCKNIDPILVNIILEQTIFYQYAKYCRKKITYLFPSEPNSPQDLGFFHASTKNKDYVHCYGFYKKTRLAYSFLERTLKQEYPSWHKRIMGALCMDGIPGDDIHFASRIAGFLQLSGDDFLRLRLVIADEQCILRRETSFDLSEQLTPSTLQVLFTTYGQGSVFTRVNTYGQKEEVKLGILLLYIDLFTEPVTVWQALQKILDFAQGQDEQVTALLYAHFNVTGAAQFREAYSRVILHAIKDLIMMSILDVAELVGST